MCGIRLPPLLSCAPSSVSTSTRSLGARTPLLYDGSADHTEKSYDERSSISQTSCEQTQYPRSPRNVHSFGGPRLMLNSPIHPTSADRPSECLFYLNVLRPGNSSPPYACVHHADYFTLRCSKAIHWQRYVTDAYPTSDTEVRARSREYLGVLDGLALGEACSFS